MGRINFFILILAFAINSVAGAGDWTFDPADNKNGPYRWYLNFPECSGTRQSPINIVTAETTKNSSLKPIELMNWSAVPGNVKFLLKNTGYAAQVDVKTNGDYFQNQVFSKQNGQTWRLAQAHMHWSDRDTSGAEHTMDGKIYPVEIHFVHTNPKYTNFSDALKFKDGLMVIGIHFQVVDNVNENAALNKVFDQLKRVIYKGQNHSLISLDLKGLVPNSILDGGYYHYPGSLTTPPCSETVTWNVMKQSLLISKKQMDNLRALKIYENGKKPSGIIYEGRARPLQPLHGRHVQECCESGGNLIRVPFLMILISVFVTLTKYFS